jgi:hypothetical protein
LTEKFFCQAGPEFLHAARSHPLLSSLEKKLVFVKLFLKIIEKTNKLKNFS